MMQGLKLAPVLLSLLLAETTWSQTAPPAEYPYPGGRGLDTVLAGGITVNNEDIQDVLTILAQYSGLSFFATKSVVGRVSFSFPQDVTVQQVLESVLPGYGWNYENDKITKSVNVMTYQEYIASYPPQPHGHKTFTSKYTSPEYFISFVQRYMSPQFRYTIIPGTKDIRMEGTLEDCQIFVRCLARFNFWGLIIERTLRYGIPALIGLLLGYLLAVYQRRRRFARLWRHAA